MSSEQINTKASRTVMIMAITATFASLAFGYDTGVINGALPYMAEPDQLNLTPALEGRSCSKCHLHWRCFWFCSWRSYF